MGRVKPSLMREGVKVQGGSGLPFFKWDMGNKYKVIFPSLEGEKDVFAYMQAVHKTMINGLFSEVRCVNSDMQVSESGKDAVVRVDEESGELLKDKASGRVLNDGTCPLCELDDLYRKFVFNEVEKWKEQNPDAEDKEVSKQYRELFDKAPVGASFKRTKEGDLLVNTSKLLLGVVYKLDDKNNYVLDKKGYPLYDIQVFNFSDSRYDKLHSAAENSREYMSETLSDLTDDFGLSWTEFIFDFPARDDKAQSGKDLTITVVPSGHSAVEKYDDLVNKVREELKDVEKFEEIFENLPSLRVRSIPQIEKDLQGRLHQYREYMTELEKSDLDESLSQDEKYVSTEDAEKMLDKDVSESSFEGKEESGEEAFLL